MTTNQTKATRQQLVEARGWISDCVWTDLAAGEVSRLTDEQVIRGIQRHYDGGWAGFLADAG